MPSHLPSPVARPRGERALVRPAHEGRRRSASYVVNFRAPRRGNCLDMARSSGTHAVEAGSQLPVDDPWRLWEIGQVGFGGCCYIVGVSEGATAMSAVASWIESAGWLLPPATYGVRSLDETAWQTFSIDSSGEVHNLRLGVA